MNLSIAPTVALPTTAAKVHSSEAASKAGIGTLAVALSEQDEFAGKLQPMDFLPTSAARVLLSLVADLLQVRRSNGSADCSPASRPRA